jgi:hypothetical protein
MRSFRTAPYVAVIVASGLLAACGGGSAGLPGVPSAVSQAGRPGSSSETKPAPTPKPTPMRDCVRSPHVCGFPDQTNTGVPAGTKLVSVPAQKSSGPGWYYDSRGYVVVNGAGAVLDSLDFNGVPVVIEAPNVTVKRCRVHDITGQSTYGIAVGQNGTAGNGALIEDTEVSGKNATTGRVAAAINQISSTTGMRVLRVNIFYAGTGIQPAGGHAFLENSYIHDMGYIAGDHTNGITSNLGGDLTVYHTTVHNRLGQTDAVGLFEDFGRQSNVLIDDNLLAGGSYTIYGGDGSKGATTGIRILNNRISPIYFPLGGQYGWIAYFSASGAGNVENGNVWDDTGAPVP